MTLIHGAGIDRPAPRIVTYSRPSAANPPRPLKNSRSGATGTSGDALADGKRCEGGATVSASCTRTSCSGSVPRRPISTARAIASSRERVSTGMRSARRTNTEPRARSAPICSRDWLVRTCVSRAI